MIVLQIARFRLNYRANSELSKTAYDQALDWLSHWTAPRNFKLIVADGVEEGLKFAYEDLDKLLPEFMTSMGVKLRHLDFEFKYEHIEDCRFWPPGTFSGTWVCCDVTLTKVFDWCPG